MRGSQGHDSPSDLFTSVGSHIEGESRGAWDRLLQQVGIPSLLVAIQQWLGSTVERWFAAEDILQETLKMAWRDRHRFEWRGVAAFRKWLLQIARNRVHDASDYATAKKRHAVELSIHQSATTTSSPLEGYAGPIDRTTPSQLAWDRELAQILFDALECVPHDCRDVVRLRLFEEYTLADVGRKLDLGIQAVRHRLSTGIAVYGRELRQRRAAPTGA